MKVCQMAIGLLGLAVAAGLAVAPASAAPTPMGDVAAPTRQLPDSVLGEKLVHRFFDKLQTGDARAMAAFLSPAFQIARSDGSTMTRTGYLRDLPDVVAYEVAGYQVTRSGNDLVVRYVASTTENADGKQQTSNPAPRLSAFAKDAKTGTWRMLVQANFSPFVGQAPVDQWAGKDAASAADTAKGVELANHFFDLLQAKDVAGLDTLLSPAFQIARADGSTSTKAEYLLSPASVQEFVLSDFVVTGSGRTLVAQYTATLSETINGQVFAKDPVKRLTVFTQQPKTGEWQMLAHANFNAPVR